MRAPFATNLVLRLIFDQFSKRLKMPDKRQAHNLKVVGSNPTPATKNLLYINSLYPTKI